MPSQTSNQAGSCDYEAFGCRVRADRPIPFERSSDGREQPRIFLVERATLRSEIELRDLECFHDAEDFPGGPRLGVYRGATGFVVDHQNYRLRFLPEQERIEYSVRFENDEQFRFGLMVERIAIPLFLLLTRPSIVGIHGGAVALNGAAWTFIGPSGVGKSTTARALLSHGARLLADDLTLVDATAHQILPGCPAVRLWEGEGAVREAVHDTQLTEQIAKRWFRIAPRHVQSEAALIAGLIVLEPVAHGGGSEPHALERLRGQAAFTAVMRQVFNFSDPEPDFATQQFRNVRTLLNEHPVIRYRYRRSDTGEPTHVEPLFEFLQQDVLQQQAAQERTSDHPDAPDRP